MRRRLLCVGSVVGLIASVPGLSAAASPDQHGTSSAPLSGSWRGPLSTSGRYIVDADGNRFKLKSANWDGAQGSWNGSGDKSDPRNHAFGVDTHEIPRSLDRSTMAQILGDLKAAGVNSLRLPFSDEMLHDTRPVPDAAVRANPELRGRTPLQVFDAVVKEATDEGIAVILNNHTTTSRWCCGVDGNERWNSGQTTRQWEDDWLMMARRYKDNPRVVGADLRNEIRRDIWDNPNWGRGDKHDWYAASQEVADRILTEANPNLLMVVEGINWVGIPLSGFTHYRPTLKPVRTLSNTLVNTHKLVYSAHFYGYTGPSNTGADSGPGATSDPKYRDFSRDELFKVLDQEALYVTQTGQHYTAPVWISEFGDGTYDDNAKQHTWWKNFTDYLAANDTDFAFWAATGAPGQAGNPFVLNTYDTAGKRTHSILDPSDWRSTDWKKLVDAPGKTGPVTPVDRYNMLSTDHGDQNESARLKALPDWDSGAHKAVCPDSERLDGISHWNGRGLCTDTNGGSLIKPDGKLTVVNSEQYVTQDWFPGETKFQCPADQAVIGYSFRHSKLDAVLCAEADRQLGTQGRTLNIWDHDDRPAGAPGGDFAPDANKAQCAADEYVAGIARSPYRLSAYGHPVGMLCRKIAG